MTETFHGQFGEDRILAGMVAIGSPQTCVEVGANDGITGSVTLVFERAGWKCILVEPNPSLCERLRLDRTAYLFEGAASAIHGRTTLKVAEGGHHSHAVSSIEPGAQAGIRRQGLTVRDVEVEMAPLDRILEDAGAIPGEIAFVSIDVEGHEAAVLKGFTLSRWRPRILIIEDNSLLFGNDMRALLAQQGYIPFKRTGVNDWYAAETDTALLGPHPHRDYIAAMVRARGLMLRRHLATMLIGLPGVGHLIERTYRSLRGSRRD